MALDSNVESTGTMGDDMNFFAAPTVETADEDAAAPIILGDAPPAPDYAPMGDDADYTAMGDAVVPGGGAFVGDVNEADAFAVPPSDDPFAAPPAEFGAPAPDGYDAFGAPPAAEDAPILLGGPPPDAAVEDDVDKGPSPMQKWNEEWTETLKNRKDEENNTKAEMLENSRLELKAFQQEREKKKQARIAKNREDEQAKLEAIEADLENDSSWQRACKMVELQHDSTEKAEDVKRMRDTLIALKNNHGKALELCQ